MKKLQVGKTITKYTEVLTDAECDFLFRFTKEQTDNPVTDVSKVPWEMGENSNTLYFPAIADQAVRDLIKRYKNTMADLISEDIGIKVYPHFTTLVLWKPGQHMPRHVDNGNGFNREQDLGMRFITSVSYMNDNYTGGYTFIRNDGINDHLWRADTKLSFPNDVFEDYLSKPEKGATVVFYADDSNAHGVTPLESGERVILSTWFTDQKRYQENDDIIYNINRNHETGTWTKSQGTPEQTTAQTTVETLQQINEEHKSSSNQMQQSWLHSQK